jgi:hypothetical protein
MQDPLQSRPRFLHLSHPFWWWGQLSKFIQADVVEQGEMMGGEGGREGGREGGGGALEEEGVEAGETGGAGGEVDLLFEGEEARESGIFGHRGSEQQVGGLL